MSKTKQLTKPEDVSREAPPERELIEYRKIANPIINEAQFQVLSGKTPDYAIKSRVGRGGNNFRYVQHGYVTDRLNKAFGWNWSHKLYPVFNGNIYELKEYDEVTNKGKANEKIKHVRNIGVYGELTIRVPDPTTKGAWLEVTKPGFGSQPWEEGTEYFDACKGAESDSLKVAAVRLGVALDLYYDDQAELQRFESEKEQTRQWEQQQATEVLQREPTTLVELISKAQAIHGLDATMLASKLGVDSIVNVKDFAAAWKVLSNGNGGHA